MLSRSDGLKFRLRNTICKSVSTRRKFERRRAFAVIFKFLLTTRYGEFGMRLVCMTRASLVAFFVLFLTFFGCSQSIDGPSPGLNGKSRQVKLPAKPKAGDRLTVKVRGANLTFRYCPPGEFTMDVIDFSDKYLPDLEEEEDEEGNVDVPEKPIRVKITRGFWIQETELTRKQAVAISGKKDYSRSKYDDGVPSNNGDYPFWGSKNDFDQLLKELNADGTVLTENMTPHEKITPDGWKFELPTEAEWEYASRAGSDDPESDEETDKHAWTKDNSDETAHKVGSKKANKWGLCDMRGNMWERVRVPQDHTLTDMPDQQILDEDGTLHDPDNLRGRFQVIKGGGIGMTAKDCKSKTWSYYEGRWSPLSFQGDVGGRFVLVEEASVLKPDRKQIVRERGFDRWRRLHNEETTQRSKQFFKEVEERRKREQEELEAARKANPDAFKTPEQRAREQIEKIRREAEEEQAAMERREIENVMRDQQMTEEQAKEFLAKRRAEARQADETFDKEHGLDAIEDPIERARRRTELRREEFEKNRKKMIESNPQMAEFEKRAEENRKKFEERREANRKKFEERRKQLERESEDIEKEFEERRKKMEQEAEER